MKANLTREVVIPFTLTVNIETYQEFKDLYGAVHGIKSLSELATILNKFSDDNRISV